MNQIKLRLITVAVLVASLADAGQAQAQAPRRTAVIQTATSDPNQKGLAGAVEQTVRHDLAALEVAEIATSPALPLEELQFAVGCMGVSDACLTQIAESLGVEALVLSSIERTGDAAVLELTRFDAGLDQFQRASRRASGEAASSTILDQVQGALREVYGLPDPPEVSSDPAGDEAPAPQAATAQPADGAGQRAEQNLAQPPAASAPNAADVPVESGFRRALPYLLGGAGLATLGVGLGLGVMSSKSEADFRNAPVVTRPDVDQAQALQHKAARQALAANILFGAGGALIVTSAILLFTGSRREDTSRGVVMAPLLTGSAAGLVIAGRHGGLR